MSTYEPKLTRVPHEYPFIMDYAYFSKEDESFDCISVGGVLFQITGKLLQNTASNNSSPKEIDSIGDLIVDGAPSLLVFGDKLRETSDQLERHGGVSLTIPLSKVVIKMKRFGLALGFQLLDSNNKRHEKATKLVEQLIASRQLSGVRQLFVARKILAPCWREDVCEQLDLMSKYVPDVKWEVTGLDSIAKSLYDDYIQNGEGVQVGRYHDIPVYMKVIDGMEGKNDLTWRDGALKCNGSTLTFSNRSHCSPSVQFSVRMFDPVPCSAKASAGIDYREEQLAHEALIEILFQALKSRCRAALVKGNPIQWRIEPDKVAG